MRNILLKSTCIKALIITLLFSVNSAYAVGTQGPMGLMGPAGPQGLKGAKGDKGEKGVKGDTGPQGIQGVKGDKGATGARGPAGLPQAGNNVGDMQYWDGTQWLIIPLGPVNATLRNCNGAPIWVVSSCTPTNTKVYHIGDTGPAGGKVFYLSDNTRLHGLEAAPADLVDQNDHSEFAWGCYVNGNYTSVSGAQGTAVGTGPANTAAIVAACSEANTAAKMVDAYTLNGYSDWFLPSKDELDLLYEKKSVVGSFAGNLYWSSSEYDTNSAWLKEFGNAIHQFSYKRNPYPVRAVRAF